MLVERPQALRRAVRSPSAAQCQSIHACHHEDPEEEEKEKEEEGGKKK